MGPIEGEQMNDTHTVEVKSDDELSAHHYILLSGDFGVRIAPIPPDQKLLTARLAEGSFRLTSHMHAVSGKKEDSQHMPKVTVQCAIILLKLALLEAEKEAERLGGTIVSIEHAKGFAS